MLLSLFREGVLIPPNDDRLFSRIKRGEKQSLSYCYLHEIKFIKNHNNENNSDSGQKILLLVKLECFEIEQIPLTRYSLERIWSNDNNNSRRRSADAKGAAQHVY